MTNLEKYDKAFLSNLKVTKDQLPGLKYRGIEAWDSVAHMDLIADLEDAFDIMMEMKDILDFNSYRAWQSGSERGLRRKRREVG